MTALGDAFAGMAPGTWKEFTGTGLTRNPYLINPHGADDIIPFAGRGVWDPIYRRFMFWGAPHAPTAPSGQGFNQIVYDEATNKWTLCQITPTCPQMVFAASTHIDISSHAFDFTTIDPVNQDFYRYVGGNSSLIGKWHLPTTPITWTHIQPNLGSTAAPAIEYFPEMDGGQGGLVLAIMVGASDIFRWHKKDNSVDKAITLTPTFGGSQNYHTTAAHNPVHHCVLVGGGNGYKQMGLIWADGRAEQLTAPGNIKPGITSGKLTCDPASGDFLVFNGDNTFWQFNPVTKAWTQLPNPPNSAMYPWGVLPDESIHEFTYAPISTYGGVMCVHSSGAIFLYKHATFVGDTTPPTVAMTAPANGATVSGTIAVSASASDNVGVVGVQFLLDGAALQAEDTAAPYSINWNTTTTANGSHTLSARARDAAGNQTTATSVTVTVNNAVAPGGRIALTLR